MAKILANFLLAAAFFTRIPVPQALGSKIDNNARLTDAVACFPLIGLVVGLITAAIWFIATHFLPSGVAAGLAIVSGLLVTGALHEDGFADCADGLGGTGEKDKALEIMRDSRVGTYGALALLASVGLRWVALASLGIVGGALALLIAHTSSRCTMTLAMKFSGYARPEGLGKLASGEVSDASFTIGLLIAFCAGFLIGGFAGLVSVSLAMVFAWGFLQYLKRRLGGFTGDGLGAMQQIAEITIMITLAGFWS